LSVFAEGTVAGNWNFGKQEIKR